EPFGRNGNDPGRTLMEIKGKTVLVTGASSGVGAAIAKEMALAGAGELLLLASNENELKKVAAAIASLGGKSRIYPVDLSNPDQVTAIAQRIEREATVPDIIVNNAGYSGQWKFLDETTPKEIQDMMAVPYFAAAWLTRAFLPAMRARNSGHIVNISSVGSRFAWPGATAYIAARWAIRGLTQALRADLHGCRVGVTLYESAEIESPYWARNPGSLERIPKIAKMIPVLKPEEVGKAVVAGVRANKRLIVIPFMMKLIYVQHGRSGLGTTEEVFSMCDYSLHNVKSRPAKVGDKLTTHHFNTGTRGFAAPEDANTAVCVLPGTELAFAREVGCRPRSLLGWKASTVNHTTAIFRQINKDDPRTHHDALEFPDGQIVLLTDLFEDQEATVLQLPAQPATAAEAAAQERVALVG